MNLYYFFLRSTSVFLITITLSAFGQNEKDIYFNSGNFSPTNSIEKYHYINDDSQMEEYVNENYYKLITFITIPSLSAKAELKRIGVDLLQYIPKNTYYASIAKGTDLSILIHYHVKTIEEVKVSFKLSKRLSRQEYPGWAIDGNKILLNAVFHSNISKEEVINYLNNKGIEIVLMSDASVIRIKLDRSKEALIDLYEAPHFYYFEEIDAPEEPEGTIDRTGHRSNTIATDYPSGIKFDGTGVTVMLQDNSILDNHIDYTGRFSNHSSASQTGDHGEHCGGIIAAAGNKDPKGKGMAFGAGVLVYGPDNNNYNYVPTLYSTDDLTITSKSYGNGNNDGYTSLTQQLDQQVYMFPSLVHVFSAGNSGTQDFGYGAGAGWGNITGGHKQGKNVIAVGNVTVGDALASSSSRGPAHDGRIKPDICAVGTDVYSTKDANTYVTKTGTSMACPGVAGSLAQLYHAYKSMNGNANPNSGLIKACILNTGEDLGNDGPDYKHGWGRINVRRAYQVLNNNNFLNSTIAQGGNNVHTINVPAGTKQLRVMLYWTDVQAAPSASLALINDINMQVVDPGSTMYNPWVLDETPNSSTLDLPATRGVDDLNNMEQVTIDNPTAGNYSVNINGFSIPQGPQEYYIVYEFIIDEVVVTFPTGGEGFPPGPQTIRWDSNDDLITSTFLLEYSIDNGLNWNIITSGAPGILRQYNWVVPGIVTGEAKIRITQGAFSDESDEVFSLIGTPVNLNVAWACPGTLNLTWDSVNGASGYEVYLLGNKYMDSQGTTTNTDFTVVVNSSLTSWLSVRALGPTNAIGERAIAIEKTPGTFSCVNGMQDLKEANKIKLYPNPAFDKLTISGLAEGGSIDILVYNILGEAVFEQLAVYSSSEVSIDISPLKKGAYFVRVTSSKQVITKKFVKE